MQAKLATNKRAIIHMHCYITAVLHMVLLAVVLTQQSFHVDALLSHLVKVLGNHVHNFHK